MRTEDAFIVAVSKSRAKEAHGRWIPADYWLEKVKYILSELDIIIKLTPKKLVTKLEKQGFLDRDFSSDEHTFGTVKRIHSNNSKVTLADGGKEKTIYFLFLESRNQQPPTKSTLQMWQQYHDSFLRRQTHRLRVDRLRAGSNQEEALRVTTTTIVEEQRTEQSSATTPARPVTPTGEPINTDIKALLELFIDLDGVTLKANSGGNRGLRAAIKAFGCRLQRIDNEAVAKTKRDNDNLTLEAVNSHKAFLDRHCCPPRKSCIQSFIALARKIDSESPCTDIFQLTKAGGAKGSGVKLVPVIPTTTPRYFNDNAKQWLPRVVDAAVADDSLNQYDSCYLLFKALKRLEPKAFDDVWRTSSNRGNGKMDIHRQMAMAKEANMPYSQLRVIRPFFIADKVNPLHSEHAVRALELHSSQKPVFIDFKEDQYKRNGWYLPLDKIVEEFAGMGGDEIHVILSADHGQGHWKANIACVLISNGSVVKESNTVVASVECRKDKRQVLIDCGMPAKINQLLNELKESHHGTNADGAVGNTNTIPLKLFATGDLAWYAEALGKPNMAGDHCSLCRWRCQKARKANPKEHFPEWLTMNQLKSHFNRLEDGTFDRAKKSEECGVVATPLIDAIEPPNYITPLLHCVTLFVNTPFKYLHRWIWYRIEGVALELIQARDELALLAIDKDRLWEEVLEAQEHLHLMYAELEGLSPEDCFDFDDESHEAEHQQQRCVVEEAEKAVEEAELDHESAVAAVRKAAAKVSRLEGLKRHGRAHQDVWMLVQNRLKELKVYSSAYHGGDLEGNQCRELMKQAPAVMHAVKDIVLEHLAAEAAEGGADTSRLANTAEVELFCSGFERLFQYFDVVSHYCYQPYGSQSDGDIAKLELGVDRLVDLYLKLLPNCPMKLHMIAVHLVPHMKRFRGLKSHHESHIERAHQQGMKDRRRLGVLGCFAKKTVSALKTAATANKPEVLAMAEDTQQQRKRKAAVLGGGTAAEDAREAYLNGILELPAMVDEFPSLLELAKESLKD